MKVASIVRAFDRFNVPAVVFMLDDILDKRALNDLMQKVKAFADDRPSWSLKPTFSISIEGQEVTVRTTSTSVCATENDLLDFFGKVGIEGYADFMFSARGTDHAQHSPTPRCTHQHRGGQQTQRR